MKHFYFLLLFLTMNSYSMESFQNFILTNHGSKIDIKPNFFRIDYVEKKIFYKLTSSDVESKMSFKDFDFILIGKNKFKTYKLNSLKVIDGYFVLCENSSKALILSTKSDAEGDDGNLMNYVFHIVDLNNNIVEGVQFDSLEEAKTISIRAEMFSMIQLYFGDC